jgi:hypothetical protein
MSNRITSFQKENLHEAIQEAMKKKSHEEEEEEEEEESGSKSKKKHMKEAADKNKSIDGEEDSKEEEDDETAKVKAMKKKEHMKESTAMDSLKPNSRPAGTDPKSKIDYITHTIGAMHGMKKEDLTKWFHDAMNLIGKETSHLPGSANEKSNENSIRMKGSYAVGKGGPSTNMPMPKISVKEDVEEMFSESDLSEEFKEKASTLFEAAVTARTMVEIARLEEEYEIQLEEAIESVNEELTSRIDSYLDYVVEQWMTENEVAVESTLRNEITTDFIDGLKNLFAEHYIDVPSDKVDVIEALADKVEVLEAKLDEQINENVDIKRAMLDVEKETILESYFDDLALSQQEKFTALAEGVEFDGDLDKYSRKLSIIKETYFAAGKKVATSTNIEEETFESDVASETVSYDASVNKYVTAISRSIKK